MGIRSFRLEEIDELDFTVAVGSSIRDAALLSCPE